MQARVHEGHPIVGADRLRKAELAERPLELLAVFSIYRYGPWWLRAIRRRRRPREAGAPPLDPWITVGLRSAPALYIATLLAVALMPLRLYFGWPLWVWRFNAVATLALALFCFVCVAILGVRIALEERRFRASEQVS